MDLSPPAGRFRWRGVAPATAAGFTILSGVPLHRSIRSTLRRLEREAALWREEPIKRVAVRNRFVRPRRVRQFHAFGEQSILDRPQWLYGTKHISVGAFVVILRDAWLAVERPGWTKQAPVLEIGDSVAIRFGCTISAVESIIIEESVGMGANVSIIDSKHTWAPGDMNPMHGPIESAPIRIGRGSWLADRVTVAAGADIGEQCSIGPNSTVSGTIRDYSIVLGNPGRIVGSTRT
jgi:acetyltransferase-like isoleucine patch superfamily enzyme